MRAVYVEIDLIQGSILDLDEDITHHLNVARVKINEEILVINGKGTKAKAIIQSINKKFSSIKIRDVYYEPRKNNIKLAIGVPKKDAFEDIIKMAIELGIEEIQPLTSAFSQYEYVSSDRINRLIESAIVQSNNLYRPIIREQISLENFLKKDFSQLCYFSSRPIENLTSSKALPDAFILIGPEGGFSDEESHLIEQANNALSIHLETAIMRAPTAVAASVGYIMGTLKI